jgi:hypothetical protein
VVGDRYDPGPSAKTSSEKGRAVGDEVGYVRDLRELGLGIPVSVIRDFRQIVSAAWLISASTLQFGRIDAMAPRAC